MAAYIVSQIINGKLTYKQVTTARQDLKTMIDDYILEKGLNINKNQ